MTDKNGKLPVTQFENTANINGEYFVDNSFLTEEELRKY
jgi:hypothetical protein